MSGPIGLTVRRTLGRARNLFSTAFASASFLLVASLAFVFGLEKANGASMAVTVVWAASLAPVLPILASFLATDVWSDERQSGRIELLLSAPVRERDFVIGKFLGTWLLLLTNVVLSLAASLAALGLFSPETISGLRIDQCLLAVLALGLQGAVWCAAASFVSACFRRVAAAMTVSVVVLAVLPRALWKGLLTWSEAGRTAFGEMPLDAHVFDIASGVMPVGTVLAYGVLTVVLLLLTTKKIASLRFVGCGGWPVRLSTAAVTFLAVVLAVLSVILFVRVNPIVDVTVAGLTPSLSHRTRSILSGTSGRLSVTCFLPRSHVRFRTVGKLLRLLKRESESQGGAHIDLTFVDPRWDIGPAGRLVRRGIAENSLVFEKGRRIASIEIDGQCNERLCASTIQRVSMPPRRQNVYWTSGHGESSPDDYGAFGMSDIARELAREGFDNCRIDLTDVRPIPSDCALIVISGPRNDFSRAEIGRLDAYLREGGRLLVLLGASGAGVSSLLPTWGIRPSLRPVTAGRTLSGTDVIVSDFADHPVVASLVGSRIVLERPVSFAASSAAGLGSSVDRIVFSSLASVGGETVAAVSERGVGTGSDLALRPTRIVVVGDDGFVVNQQLAARACANRDFFLNCVDYLSGTEIHGGGIEETDTLKVEMDRETRRHFVLFLTGGVPAALLLMMLAVALRRRIRS